MALKLTRLERPSLFSTIPPSSPSPSEETWPQQGSSRHIAVAVSGLPTAETLTNLHTTSETNFDSSLENITVSNWSRFDTSIPQSSLAVSSTTTTTGQQGRPAHSASGSSPVLASSLSSCTFSLPTSPALTLDPVPHSSFGSNLSYTSITHTTASAETSATATTVPSGEQSCRNGGRREPGSGSAPVSAAAYGTNQALFSPDSYWSGVDDPLTHQPTRASSPNVPVLVSSPSPQAVKKRNATRRPRSFSVPGVTLGSKSTKAARLLGNTRTSTSSSSSSNSTKSVSGRQRNRGSFLKRMLRLTRTHSMPVPTTDGSSNSIGNSGGLSSRPRTNTFSFPVIQFHRTLSDKNSKDVGSQVSRSASTLVSRSTSTSLTAPLSGASLAAITSAIHHGNFLQLSDYNLDLLVRTLAGKNSTALETIIIKSAAISANDARLLARLIRSSDAANIKVLKLDRNAISQDAFKYIFRALKQNRTITSLSMSRSGVDDKAIKHIAKALAKTETLKELDLSNNRITAQGIQVLCEALILNKSLTRLCIQSNAINKAGAPHIAALLTRNCVIRHLNVGSNSLGTEGCVIIANAVRLNGTLNSLSLDMNEMGSMGASAIAAALASNRHLTHLYIPHNNIGDQGLAEICENLKQNNSLIGLDLELNHIGHGQSVVGMKALAEVLKTNRCLREINLSYNVFSAEAIQELMNGVAVNPTLESIVLTNCCISTQGAITIAEVLPSATGLQNLGLTANPDIAVEGYWALATSLSKSRSVKGIQLDYNSEGRHVLYESIQCSLTKNFLWQQAVYTAACRILALSRIVLLGLSANRWMPQSQPLQRQPSPSSGACSLLRKVGLGRSNSSKSMASMLTLDKDWIIFNAEYSSSHNETEASNLVQKYSRQGVNLSASTPSSPSVQRHHLFDGNQLPAPHQRQHPMDQELLKGQPYRICSSSSSSSSSSLLRVPMLTQSPSEPVMADYNPHKAMANLINMPHEIFELICAFLDPGQNMSMAQIRTTIRMAGDKSTLSESHTRASTLEKIFHSRYIPSIGMRYGIKNVDERV